MLNWPGRVAYNNDADDDYSLYNRFEFFIFLLFSSSPLQRTLPAIEAAAETAERLRITCLCINIVNNKSNNDDNKQKNGVLPDVTLSNRVLGGSVEVGVDKSPSRRK